MFPFMMYFFPLTSLFFLSDPTAKERKTVEAALADLATAREKRRRIAQQLGKLIESDTLTERVTGAGADGESKELTQVKEELEKLRSEADTVLDEQNRQLDRVKVEQPLLLSSLSSFPHHFSQQVANQAFVAKKTDNASTRAREIEIQRLSNGLHLLETVYSKLTVSS